MKKLILLFSAFAILSCNNNQSEQAETVSNPVNTEQVQMEEETDLALVEEVETVLEETKEVKKEVASQGPEWNYSGTINKKYKIKAFLEFEDNRTAAGGLMMNITGYYYYESTKVKIPVYGTASGAGYVTLTAKTNDGEEEFSGEFHDDAFLEDFSGTWTNGKNTFPFELISNE